ncbi:MAG TPA: phage tail protein [Streptosporangiaceae bacterium]|nr:phage tail protein [Streptosporangiaceae bacterium]
MTQSSTEFALIASAPIFLISAPNLQITLGPPGLAISNLAFQELGGINSEINIEQYVSVDSMGNVNHTKQMGLTKPPTVTLKRGVDSNLALWYWHYMALIGMPTARTDVTLEMYGGGAPTVANVKPLFTYTLQNAWCAKINIAGAKAGEGLVTEDVTIACDRIVYGDG